MSMRDMIRQAVEDFDTSLLLVGSNNQPMMKDARYAASFLLGTDEERLDAHPDFMCVGMDDKAKSIGVDAAEAVIHRSLVLPAIARKVVVVIDEINKMTVPAQNKLLKTLEECKTLIIIGIAYEDTLIPTVKSRVKTITYQPMFFELYKSKLEEKEGFNKDPVAYYYASGGNIDSEPDKEVVSVFTDVKDAMLSRNAEKLFSAFHMVKEKDSDAFFSKHRDYVAPAISLMGDVAIKLCKEQPGNKRYRACASYLSKQRAICNDLSYTRDSFFLCVMGVVENLK